MKLDPKPAVATETLVTPSFRRESDFKLGFLPAFIFPPTPPRALKYFSHFHDDDDTGDDTGDVGI